MGKRSAILTVTVLTISFLLVSILILYDQKKTIGVWFQIGDVVHHESIAIFSFAVAIGIVLGAITYAVLDRV